MKWTLYERMEKRLLVLRGDPAAFSVAYASRCPVESCFQPLSVSDRHFRIPVQRRGGVGCGESDGRIHEVTRRSESRVEPGEPAKAEGAGVQYHSVESCLGLSAERRASQSRGCCRLATGLAGPISAACSLALPADAGADPAAPNRFARAHQNGERGRVPHHLSLRRSL